MSCNSTNRKPLRARPPMRRALVVGIDDYAGEGRDLASCVADAQAMSALLREAFSFTDIEVLTNREASLSAFQRSLDGIVDGVQPEDRVVIFFSGHGTRFVQNDTMREALVLQDLQLLEDRSLVAATQRLPPGTFTLLLDSCFSGGLWKSSASTKALSGHGRMQASRYQPFASASRSIRGPVSSGSKGEVMVRSDGSSDGQVLNGLLISACRAAETALADIPGSDGLSAFTFAFARAIEALGSQASARELIFHATARLRDLDALQTPEIREAVNEPHLAEAPLFNLPNDTPFAPRPANLKSRERLALAILRAFQPSLARDLSG